MERSSNSQQGIRAAISWASGWKAQRGLKLTTHLCLKCPEHPLAPKVRFFGPALFLGTVPFYSLADGNF